MKFSGYADEAADDLAGQIRATRALGWNDIELRKIDGTFVHDLDADAFDHVAGTLRDADFGVWCVGSGIANGGKLFDNPDDQSLAEARRCVPRLQRLGTRFVRLMSWPLLPSRPLSDQLGPQRITRLREICSVFIDAGITPVHENCGNWGGLGARFSLDLIEQIPGLKLAFDPGNAVHDRDGDAQALADGTQPYLSAWDFYRRVRDHVAHVHVKDAFVDGHGAWRWCWPGEGHGDLARIITDLLAHGYDGCFAIEPHLGTGTHHGLNPLAARIRTYVEYGRRTEALIATCRAQLAAEGHGLQEGPL